MKHRFLLGTLLATLLLYSPTPLPLLAAEEVSFKASAPSQVILNKPFQLTFTVNQKARDLQPAAWEHFEVLAGPYTSQSQSTSFVNGKMSSSFSLTYTYTLLPTEEGTFAINPATITVSGDTYHSNGLKITVLPPDQPATPSAAGDPTAGGGRTAQRSSSQQGGQDIFIRTLVSKTNVSEQEAIYLCYKLYFADVDVAQFTNNTKIPEFTGFLKQELENGEIQTELEHYNGRNYQSAVLYKTILYPQHSGDIKIDPASFEAILRVQNRAQIRSIFDDFFGSYTNVAQMLTAPGVTIHVRALPTGKPEDFSGAVGTFKLTSSISPNSHSSGEGREEASLKANEAVTIKLDIQGSGNMKLIKTPAVDWPEGFEPYDPKVTNNFRTTTQGTSGTKSIEYLAIPRAAGQYLIPSIHFAYYDTQAKTYKTLSTPEYMVNVLRDGNSLSASSASGLSAAGGLSGEAGPSARSAVLKEDIHHLGTDIRYIHTSEPRPSAAGGLTGEAGHTAQRSYSAAVLYGYLLPFLLALIVFLFLRRYAKEHANAAHVRYKKANKVAQKRLRQAEKLLKANDLSHFYEELERALWQYLSDRLRIQIASLNKENIASVLQSKQVNSDLIASVNDVITTTQIARYTSFSAQPTEEAQQLYNQTIELINDLENQKL